MTTTERRHGAGRTGKGGGTHRPWYDPRLRNRRQENDGIAASSPTYGDGIRAALPLFLPTLLIGASFGVAAEALGWGVAAPVVMSIIVFSGSAQFASTGVLAAGGGIGAAVIAGTMFNLR